MDQYTQHHRPMITEALLTRFAKWIYKARMKDILSAALRLCALVAVPALIFAPQFLFGLISSSVDWKTGAVIVWIVSFFYGRNCMRWAKRKKYSGNQNTYEGIPIDELSTFIMDNLHFRRLEAMKHFGMSKKKHDRIAKLLEKHEVLVRGPNNSRVLQDQVTREILVRQLRDKFPMRFNVAGGNWSDKDSSYESYLHSQDTEQRKKEQNIKRLERKELKLKNNIQERQLNPLFIRRQLVLE